MSRAFEGDNSMVIIKRGNSCEYCKHLDAFQEACWLHDCILPDNADICICEDFVYGGN